LWKIEGLKVSACFVKTLRWKTAYWCHYWTKIGESVLNVCIASILTMRKNFMQVQLLLDFRQIHK